MLQKGEKRGSPEKRKAGLKLGSRVRHSGYFTFGLEANDIASMVPVLAVLAVDTIVLYSAGVTVL